MGYIKHNAIVVAGCDSDRIEKAHAIASHIFKWVSPISPEQTNGYRAFFVPPDGSKEGWEYSDNGDSERQEFFDEIKKHKEIYVDIVDVRFGGDDEMSTVKTNWDNGEYDE